MATSVKSATPAKPRRVATIASQSASVGLRADGMTPQARAEHAVMEATARVQRSRPKLMQDIYRTIDMVANSAIPAGMRTQLVYRLENLAINLCAEITETEVHLVRTAKELSGVLA